MQLLACAWSANRSGWRHQTIIATLGTMGIYRGLTHGYPALTILPSSGRSALYHRPFFWFHSWRYASAGYRDFRDGSAGRRLSDRCGRHVIAVGSNEDAGTLFSISVRKCVLSPSSFRAFASLWPCCYVCALGSLGHDRPDVELQAITAVVVAVSLRRRGRYLGHDLLAHSFWRSSETS